MRELIRLVPPFEPGTEEQPTGNPTAPNDQQMYLRALRTVPNLTITYGHFLTHSVSMTLTGVKPTKRACVDKTEEKGSDVNLASHLVRDGYQKRISGGSTYHEL